MKKEDLSVSLCIRMMLLIYLLNHKFVIGLKESLFASISQLELLWQNDIHVVKMMEKLLEEPIAEYKPFKRYKLIEAFCFHR